MIFFLLFFFSPRCRHIAEVTAKKRKRKKEEEKRFGRFARIACYVCHCCASDNVRSMAPEIHIQRGQAIFENKTTSSAIRSPRDGTAPCGILILTGTPRLVFFFSCLFGEGRGRGRCFTTILYQHFTLVAHNLLNLLHDKKDGRATFGHGGRIMRLVVWGMSFPAWKILLTAVASAFALLIFCFGTPDCIAEIDYSRHIFKNIPLTREDGGGAFWNWETSGMAYYPIIDSIPCIVLWFLFVV